ncbi:MAG: tetratricopeptide repeat protein [Prevotellaceae bacterium]|nr:tetratricopeptide repeat protein [Prevotellaceae bacterium]
MSKQQTQNQALDVNTALDQNEAFVTKYKKPIIGAIVAVIVVAGGFFGFKYGYLQPKEEKAQTLLTEGLQYMHEGTYDKALNGEGTFPGYLKIANGYMFTDAANIAKVYAGIAYYESGKIKEAVKMLEGYSTRGDQSITPMALYALANCYAADGQIDAAVKTFVKAADKADNDALSPMCLVEAGKLLESKNRKDEALKLYNRVKSDYPASAFSAPQPSQTGDMMQPEIDRYIEHAAN